jgi:primosomal protein N' (replication factor Y)
MVQTFDVEHPVIQTLQGIIAEDTFLESERELRQALGYPPFGRLARIRFESESRNDAQNRAEQIARALTAAGQKDGQKIDVLGPSEAFLERARGIWRWDVLLKTRDIGVLQQAVRRAKEICLTNKWPILVDIDPCGIG